MNPRHLCILGAALLIALSSCKSGSYLSNRESRDLDKIFEESGLSDHFTGLAVYHPEKQEFLYQKNADHLFTPASNAKILTLFAALNYLPDTVPLLATHFEGRNMYLRGTANPAFLHPDFDLEVQEAQLLFTMRGFDSVFISPAGTTPDRFGPGWAWDDYTYYFQAERTVLPVFGNQFYAKWDSLRQEVDLEPSHFVQYTEVKGAKDDRILGKREEYTNQFQWKVGVQSSHEQRASVPFISEPYALSKILSDKFQNEVRIAYQPMNVNWKPYGKVPIDTVLRKMMWESDNFLAEQILLMVSHHLSDTFSSDPALRILMEDHFPEFKDRIQWVDGSGLSRYNLMSPNFLIALLDKLHRQLEHPEDFFPLNGKTGTLKDQYTDLPPLIAAKTGTLRNHHNLSGFLKTETGEWIIFSFMNDNFPGAASDVRPEMQKILSYLRGAL